MILFNSGLQSGASARVSLWDDFILFVGWRFAAALLPQLFGKNPRSQHEGATGRV